MMNQISLILGGSIAAAMLATVFGADSESSFWLSVIIIGGLIVPSSNQTFRGNWAAPAGCHWLYLATAVIGVLGFSTKVDIFSLNDLGAFFAVTYMTFSAFYFLAGYFDASWIPKLGLTGMLLVVTGLLSPVLSVTEFDPMTAVPVYIGFFSIVASMYKDKGFKNDRGH